MYRTDDFKTYLKMVSFFSLYYVCREAIGKILARGHSRVPVYSGNPKNIIGLLLVIEYVIKCETYIWFAFFCTKWGSL
jgi:CBS domain containing-hemolysin-like protein